MHPSLKAIKPNLNFDKQVQVIRPLRETTQPVTDIPIAGKANKKKKINLRQLKQMLPYSINGLMLNKIVIL